MDAETGAVLHHIDADGRRFPASLTKMMTLYIIFSKLREKKISMETPLVVPRNAPPVEPSKLGLRTGQIILIRHIILGLITKSANDAAVTVAVGLSGSVENFAKLMNVTARKLGMKNTIFYNPHGLPDSRQLTTARDMAILSRALSHHFPEYYPLFKTRVFNYKGVSHPNHNRLLGEVHGMDGIKTGYFRLAGSNLAASVIRHVNGKKRRIIAIVLGGENRFARNKRIKELIEIGFATPQQRMYSQKTTKNILYHVESSTSGGMPTDEDPIADLIHPIAAKPLMEQSVWKNSPQKTKIQKVLKKAKS